MLDAKTKKTIDSARDILVGKLPAPNTQVEQITLAMLYKFMDDIDQETIEMGGEAIYFSKDFEKYSWREIMKKSYSAQNRMNLYVEALEKFYVHPNLPKTFKQIFKNATVPYRDPEVLTLFLTEINSFDYADSEKLGDAYEYLLSILGSQGELGQFRTPRHIIDFIIDLIDPQKDNKILDPACGTAGFLISAYKHIINDDKNKSLNFDDKKKVLSNISGYDIEPSMVRIAEMNMYLHGCPEPDINEYDTLTSDDYWDNKYDIILANPPFMTPKGGITPHNKFVVKANRAEILFVDYICEHLRNSGKAGIIVPDSILYSEQTDAYINLRKLLYNSGLFAIVSLPAGLFKPYAKSIKTSILIIDKKRQVKTDKTLMIYVNADGYTLTDTRKPTSKNDLPEAKKILRDYIDYIDGKKDAVDFAKYKISTYFFDKTKLENNNYVFLASKYEKEYSVNSKYPVITIGDVIEEISEKVKDRTDIPVMSVSNKYGFTTSDELFNDAVASENVSGYKVIRKNYFAYNPSRINVGSIALLSEDKTICVSPMYTVFRIKEGFDILPEYLLMLLKSSYMISIIKKRAFGAIRVQLKYPELCTLKFPIPNSIEEQRKILDGLQKYETKINGLQKQIDDIELEKQEVINKIWNEK